MKLTQFRTDMACVIAQKRLTQKEVAHLTGVTQSCVSKFLRGDTGIGVGVFIALWPMVYDQPFPTPPPLPSLLAQKKCKNSKQKQDHRADKK